MLCTIFVYQLFWGLLSRIIGFVDVCLALSLVAFVTTNLSIACQKCTGKTLFEVVSLSLSIIGGRRRAGRASVTCQTTFGGYRSVATQTDYHDDIYDDVYHYNKHFHPRLRTNGVPCPFLRVPDESVSVFGDRRNAYRLRGRFAVVQDAEPSGASYTGVTPGTVSVGSKRNMSSFEEQSTDDECELVARPGRKILAPRIRGAGTVQCPTAPESAAFAGVLFDDNEDGTTTDVDDEEDDGLEIITDDIVPSSAPDVEDQSPRVEAASPHMEADMGEGGVEEVGPEEALVLEEDDMEFAPAGFGEEEDDDLEFAPAGFGED
ncbi:hypothetical protein RBB50_011856 [Rhinocladiella similis]